MRFRDLHPWDLTPSRAIALQKNLASQVILHGDPRDVRYVAAGDVAFIDRPYRRQGSLARVAVVVVSYPGLAVVEQHTIEGPAAFPYVPGLLSFRETPLLAQAFGKLELEPDLILVDGHGYAHPRRFGIACHLGLLAGKPAIGVAKSRLCGEHGMPAPEAGSTAELIGGGDLIGLVVRTRTNVAPLYVSCGHQVGLGEAADWVLRFCRGYRLPEPIRLADRLSKGRAL